MDQLRQRRHGLVEPVALAPKRPQPHVEVVDDLPDQLVAVGPGVRTRRRLVQKRPDGGALALKRLDELSAELVDLFGVQRTKQWPEPAEQSIQIQRGLRTSHRNRLT